MKSQFLAFALMAATAVATKDCGAHGTLEENCCVCEPGYTGPDCSTCSAGFEMLNGVCGNGRAGTTCTPDGAFPFFGCGGAGECSSNNLGEPVFPCVCKDLQGEVVHCATKIIEQTTCAPRGARMYVPYPNEPRIDLPFSLTVVTCGVTSPKLMMVPAFKEDGITENECNTRVGDFGGFSSECVIKNNPETNSTSIPETCKDGVVLSSLNSDLSVKDMAEYTFAGLTVSNSDFYITGEGNIKNRKMFKVCMSEVVPVAPGSQETETIWSSVDGHNQFVSERDQAFELATESDMTIQGAAANGVAGGDCCDGLKIGFCLPLWAFLLLWLLMALCLGFLGFALHKNKNEIEAKKNNEKYEKFNTDAEMIEHAAKEADDDDI